MDRNLLVLDDDPYIGDFISRVAGDLGLATRVTTTVEGFAAEMRRRQPTDIVLDLHLGQDDGIQILRYLAADRSEAGIILLSGFSDKILAAARDLGLELGLNIRHALCKPVTAAQLLRALAAGPEAAALVTPGDLADGIRRGELTLEYQPIVGCCDLEVRCIEALVRWRRATGELMPPDSFIPIAEADGDLMDALTMDVVERAARDWHTLDSHGRRTCIAINISAQNLRRLDFPERMSSYFERAGVPASTIKLEITETASMSAHQSTLDTLVRLRLKGYQLAIDDFGTGFTSIAMLRRLPFSELKIDRSFVSDIATSEDAFAIAGGIVALGRSMGLKTVAEGVETEDVMKVVKSLGTDAAQGYLFSRPLALERLLSWWSARDAEARPPATWPVAAPAHAGASCQ